MKASIYILITAWLMSALFGVQPGWGTEFRSDEVVSVPEGTSVQDDLAVFGQSVNIGGNVAGDLMAFGSQVSVRGRVAEDAMLAGSDVNIAGTIGDDLRAAGANLNVSAAVADNAALAGGNVILTDAAKISRDLQVAGSVVSINGSTGRNLNLAAGRATVNGTIGGDVLANVGDLNIGPKAVIRGNLIYTSPRRADIASGARIQGQRIYQPTPRKPAPFALKFAWWLASLLALYLVGVIFIALMPRGSEDIADRVVRSPGSSLLVGFILLVVVPVASMLIAVTLIGIPLALILLAAYFILIYVSRVFAALAIGRWLFGRLGRPRISLYMDMLAGLLILWLLMAIPIIGWIVHLAAILLGLGAQAAYRYTLAQRLRAEGCI